MSAAITVRSRDAHQSLFAGDDTACIILSHLQGRQNSKEGMNVMIADCYAHVSMQVRCIIGTLLSGTGLSVLYKAP